MLAKICFAVSLIAVVPVWSQVNTAAIELAGDPAVNNDSRMLTPPPVNGGTYPVAGSAQTRANYLRTGISFSSAYTDYLSRDVTGHPIGDASYSIWPTLELDKSTSRWYSVLSYSPVFTFYQRVSSHNEADENLAANLQYRLSPHVTVSLRDSFQKTSNIFNQPDLASAPVQAPTVAVIAPIADRLTNTGNAEITYQYGLNGMVGASGTFTTLHYPNRAEVPGLFDSSSKGGSTFYNHRFSKRHYLGALYQYQRILSDSVGARKYEVQTHTVSAFYTIYLKPSLSLSVSGGPQRSVAQSATGTWSPSVTASLGWRGRHTSLAASYSRTVTGGGGLWGAFNSKNANTSASWQFARAWNVGLTGTYSIYKNLGPFLFFSSRGGHTVGGNASIGCQLREHLNLEVGYMRLHQSYSSIAVVSTTPDTNREFISISYQFVRPLGR